MESRPEGRHPRLPARYVESYTIRVAGKFSVFAKVRKQRAGNNKHDTQVSFHCAVHAKTASRQHHWR